MGVVAVVAAAACVCVCVCGPLFLPRPLSPFPFVRRAPATPPHPGSDDRQLDGRVGGGGRSLSPVSIHHKSRHFYPFNKRRPETSARECGRAEKKKRAARGWCARPFPSPPFFFFLPSTKKRPKILPPPAVKGSGAHAGICGAPAWRVWEPQGRGK